MIFRMLILVIVRTPFDNRVLRDFAEFNDQLQHPSKLAYVF